MAIAMISPGTTARDDLAVGVSPMSLCVGAADRAGERGGDDEDQHRDDDVRQERLDLRDERVSAGIFSAPMAAEIANRKMNQNATAPISLAGLAPGLTRSTYWPLRSECMASIEADLLEQPATTPLTTLAMT